MIPYQLSGDKDGAVRDGVNASPCKSSKAHRRVKRGSSKSRSVLNFFNCRKNFIDNTLS
jgi:hypothetical protein